MKPLQQESTPNFAEVGVRQGSLGDAQSTRSVGEGWHPRQGRDRRPLARWARRGGCLSWALLLPALACAGDGSRLHPVASLADTTAAGLAFERLHGAWTRSDPAGRAELRRDLRAFAEAFPADGKAPLARAMLALALMEAPADWADAEKRLASLEPPPVGTAHDLYVIAVAKDLRHRHDAEGAFELLRPLVGKVVDARGRALLQEELTFDALESREPYEAIAYMDAWLRGASEEDRVASEAKVSVALGAVPEATLRGSLMAMRASARAGQSRGYGLAIQRLVSEQLGRIAVQRGDAALARWLLDPAAGEAMLDEELAASLGQLATSRRGIGSVSGRTVGLVLPTGSGDLRDEAADVLRGVLWALRAGRDAAAPDDGVRLVTRDDGGDPLRLRAAMEEVAGEGASVILTALDPETAADAVEWGRSASQNVIVLATPRAPKGPSGDAAAFTVGEDWAAELAALAAPLLAGHAARDKPTIATLADVEATASVASAAGGGPSPFLPPLSCDVASTTAGDSRFPLAAWQGAGIHRWLVAGSATCAADLVTGLRRTKATGVVALSLEASAVQAKPAPSLRLLAATAGILPLALAPTSDPRTASARELSPPGAALGWWTALGHDAAVLARAAVLSLPLDTTTDGSEIARRRALVRSGLDTARAPLWTTEERGFSASRTLPRTIRVQDLNR